LSPSFPLTKSLGFVKRILHYLKGTTSYSFHITRGFSFTLHGFIDANWVDSIDDHKSTSGYLVFFGRVPISWKSCKQRIVARSSTEAEYKALVDNAVLRSSGFNIY